MLIQHPSPMSTAPRGGTYGEVPPLDADGFHHKYHHSPTRTTTSSHQGERVNQTWLSPPPRSPSTSHPSLHGRLQDHTSEQGGEEQVEDRDTSPDFKSMMDFACYIFPEARGPHSQDSVLLLPGMQQGFDSLSAPHVKRAQPIQLMMSHVAEALTRANKSTRPAFAKYPSQKQYRAYRICESEGRNRSARNNPELAPHLTARSEPRVSLAQMDMVWLEEALLAIRDTQNLLFWPMGILVSHTLSDGDVSTNGPMLQQLVLKYKGSKERVLPFAPSTSFQFGDQGSTSSARRGFGSPLRYRKSG